MRTQPDAMDNMFGALYMFVVPKSFLDKAFSYQLMIKNEAKATQTGMPNEVIGFKQKDETGQTISQQLLQILYQPGHPIT